MRHLRRMLATVAVSVAVGLTATPSASAADTVVLDTCAATVHGEPGQQIALAPTAITWQLTAVIAPLDPLNVVRPPLNDLWNTLPPIPIGAVGPTPGVIPGAAIADAVLTQLHEIALVAPLIDVLGPPLRSLLGVNCRVPTQPARPAPPAPQPPGAQPPASSAPQPGTTAPSDVSGNVPAVPGFSGAELAPIYPQGFDRNLIPGIPPDGIPYNYGPGGVPQVGNPGLAPTVLGLRATGTAQALPVNADDDYFQRPVLLATLLLTLVGTQLIRTWVLRHAT